MAEHTKGELGLSANEGDGHPYIVQRQALYTTLIAEMLRHRLGSADRVRPDAEQTANAERLVACWNACEGMADPAAEINHLRAIAEAARTYIAAWYGGEGGRLPMSKYRSALFDALESADIRCK
jgi:hypothetical protein